VADALAVEDERRTDSYRLIFTCIHSSGEIIVVVLFKEYANLEIASSTVPYVYISR
jgi:hypothetical protein